MQPEKARRAAEIISAARLHSARIAPLPPDFRPQNEADAYEVQHEVNSILSANGRGRVVGHKIGCTTEVMQRYLGIPNPCAGALFQPSVYFEEGMLRHRDYLRPGVECEIAVFMGETLLPRSSGHTAESVAGAVQAVFAGIEVVALQRRPPAAAAGR